MGVPTRYDVAVEFPIAKEAVYLNHAASSPLPTRSADALRRYVDDRQRLFHLYQTGRQDYDTRVLREKLGALLNASAESIGFVPTTTDGVSGILNGIDWRPGDNLVVPDNEFPGILYGCLNVGRRGVTVRRVPTVGGHADSEGLIAAIDPKTRAVVASHVHWQTGHRLDIARLGAECRTRGVLSIVDAIQSLGAVPIDVSDAAVDVLVAGTYKWLLATQGLAVLYLSEHALGRVTPDRAGWTSVDPQAFQAAEFRWGAGPRRFSVGGGADPALIALEQSVGLLLEIGVENVAAHTGAIIDQMAAGLKPLGIHCNTRLDHPAVRSSILSITTGDRDADARLTASLVAQRIIVAERGPGIRVSPHIHTTADAADRLIDAVREARGS